MGEIEAKGPPTLRIQAVFDNGEEEYSIPIRVGRKAS